MNAQSEHITPLEYTGMIFCFVPHRTGSHAGIFLENRKSHYFREKNNIKPDSSGVFPAAKLF
jgi:hypothetical protein